MNADSDPALKNVYRNKLTYEEFSGIEKQTKKIDQKLKSMEMIQIYLNF